MKPKLIAILGPTGSGKTRLAETLALEFNGEIISSDAKQVYRGMDIGTNKEKLTVPQHLIDIKNPSEKITVAEYQQLAYQEINNLIAQQKLPILTGGSMLYAEAVINGYVFRESGKSDQQQPRYEVLKLGVQIDRTVLKEALASRTQQWLNDGLLDEIKTLLDQGISASWLHSCGLEYRYFTQHVRGELSLKEAITKTNISLNQYVKRQYTWWRRHNDTIWISSADEAAAKVAEFLHR